MGFFDGIFKKIPFVSRFSKKKEPVNNVELQYNKAMNLMDNGDAEESVTILEQVAQARPLTPLPPQRLRCRAASGPAATSPARATSLARLSFPRWLLMMAPPQNWPLPA